MSLGVLATLLAQGAGGGGGGPVLPYTTNLVTWLRADMGITLDGSGKVQSWLDQSPNAYLYQQVADALDRPDYAATVAGISNRPAVRFSVTAGHNKHLTNAASPSPMPLTVNNWTLIAVVVPSSQTTARQGVIFFGNSVAMSCSGNTAGRISVLYNVVAWDDTTTALANNTPAILCDIRASGILTQYQNNTALSPTFSNNPIALNASSGIQIGYPSTGNAQLRGDLAEVIIYNEPLSATNRSAVMAYLGTRYGITVAP